MATVAMVDFGKYLKTPTRTKKLSLPIFKGISWTAQINNKKAWTAKVHKAIVLAPTILGILTLF